MVDVYTDGSCYPNPGPGGWAYVIPERGIERFGAEKETTNNRMEMMGIIMAMRETEGFLTIYSDSQWCIGALTKNWKVKANLDLIAEAKGLMRGRVKFVHIRGHKGHVHNERADVLAGRWRQNVA